MRRRSRPALSTVAGWTSTSASLHRGHNLRSSDQKQTVSPAKAPMRTREDAELVTQGKRLEEEVYTRCLGCPSRSSRLEAAAHRLSSAERRLQRKWFLPDGILASHNVFDIDLLVEYTKCV
jgi:hypothetical protein